MAKGKKTGGRDWVKGQVPNPLGGGAHDPNKKAMRRLTQAQVAEVASMILSGRVEDLEAIVGNKQKGIPADANASPLKLWFATCALRGITKGDVGILDIFLNRTVGKVKDKLELTGEDGGPIEFSNMTKEQIEKELAELESKMKVE
jgi:hypothetical protein